MYSASTLPRPAQSDRTRPPQQQAAPMSRSLVNKPPRRILQALRRLEIDCRCASTLIVSCALDRRPGCRERRREGTCPCRPRELPTCLLDTPHGCAAWAAGKPCRCPRMCLPRCLVTGCDLRQRGKHCACARTPVSPCPHLLAKLAEHEGLSAAEAAALADVWAEQLWANLPEAYADRPLADAGVATHTRAARVALLLLREAWKMALFHPGDAPSLDGETRRGLGKLRRQADGLRLLLATAAARGEGRAA